MKRAVVLAGIVILFSLFAFSKKDPAEYPLRVEIVNAHWEHVHGDLHGWGRGNLFDGNSVHGFDYAYDAPVELRRTIGNSRYYAKWKKEPVKLELLLGEIGAPDKLHTYEIKVTLRDEVYQPGARDLRAAPAETPAK